MRRTLIVVVAGALVLGACGGGDDDDDTATTTTEAPATTVEETTTTFEPEVAGLLTPPDGVPQDAADGFAADMVAALNDSGWPEMDRQAAVDLLQRGLDLAWSQCEFITANIRYDPAFGASSAGIGMEQTRDGMVDGFVQSGVPREEAESLVGGYLQGLYAASGDNLCPEHAAELDDAAATL